ncbi:MAG: hypothetical protein WC548_00395 [Candidatus Pacearchaeota archaeon]
MSKKEYPGGKEKEGQDKKTWIELLSGEDFEHPEAESKTILSKDGGFSSMAEIYRDSTEKSPGEIREISECFEQLAETYKEKGSRSDATRCARMSRDLNYRLPITQRNKSFNFLRDITSVISILTFLSGLFFLSFSFTGNAIGTLTTSARNIVGGSLIIIGLVVGFFWVKQRK